MKTGIELITEERKEQIYKHGYDADHDDEYKDLELLLLSLFMITGDEEHYPDNWNPAIKAKMFMKDRIEQLTIAGALLAAEIDRLQRKKEPEFEDLNKKK